MTNVFSTLEKEILENSFTDHPLIHKIIDNSKNGYDIIESKFTGTYRNQDLYMDDDVIEKIKNTERYDMIVINTNHMTNSNRMSHSIYCFNDFMGHKVSLLTSFKKLYVDDKYKYMEMFSLAKNNTISFVPTTINNTFPFYNSAIYKKGNDAFIVGLSMPKNELYYYSMNDDDDCIIDDVINNRFIVPSAYAIIIINGMPFELFSFEQVETIFDNMKDDENFQTLKKYFELFFKDFDKMSDNELDIIKTFLGNYYNKIHNDLFNNGNIRVRLKNSVAFNLNYFDNDAMEYYSHDKNYFHNFSRDSSDVYTLFAGFSVTGDISEEDKKIVDMFIESLISNYPTIDDYKNKGYHIVDLNSGKVVIKSETDSKNDYFIPTIVGYTEIDLSSAQYKLKDHPRKNKNTFYGRTVALHNEYTKYVSTMAKLRGMDKKTFVKNLLNSSVN